MITIKDIKVVRRTKHHTAIQTWEQYWFEVGDKQTMAITKQGGIFRFYAANISNLKAAKQYIMEFINAGGDIYSL